MKHTEQTTPSLGARIAAFVKRWFSPSKWKAHMHHKKGLAAVAALPTIEQDTLDAMGVVLPSEPFLKAGAIYPKGGTGPNRTFCLQGWAAQMFGGKLKKDYSMKGKAASFIVDLLDEAAAAFSGTKYEDPAAEMPWWEKGIGFVVAFHLCDHPEVVAEIWNLTMQRLGAE